MSVQQSAAALRPLGGLINIAVTPFDNDGFLDQNALSAHVLRMLEHGYDGILVGGTYGEFATMTTKERVELFDVVARVVDGRVPLLMCSAASDPEQARELTLAAVERGGYPMIMPPFVSEVTDAQIEAFFAEMSQLAPGGIVIYNAPGVGITLSVRLIEKLAAIPNVVGLKQGELTPTVIDQLVGRLGGKIKLMAASDLSLPGSASSGFDGLSSTNSCAFPEVIAASYRAIQAGNAAEGARIHRLWFEYREFARAHGQPQTVKAAMRLRGWNGGRTRRPLLDLDAQACAALGTIVEKVVHNFVAE